MTEAIVKDYIGAETGQVHRRQAGLRHPGPPLYCLHATAYSGRTFEAFMHAIAPHRRVAALDTPGYGASDPPPADWPLARYGEAIATAIQAAETGPVDLLGYHTGALLAVEIAARHPDRVRRIVLIGVPYFQGPDRERMRRTLARPMRLEERLGQFAERWDFFVTQRPPGVTLEQGFAHFVDELSAWPFGWWAHEAAFTYEPEPTLTQVGQPALVLNPQNHLSESSRAAARLMANCEIHELPHLTHAVLDLAPAELAGLANAFLAS